MVFSFTRFNMLESSLVTQLHKLRDMAQFMSQRQKRFEHKT